MRRNLEDGMTKVPSQHFAHREGDKVSAGKPTEALLITQRVDTVVVEAKQPHLLRREIPEGHTAIVKVEY